MPNESDTIGQRLRARRVALGRTLAEVAEQSGLSLPYVSNLERGRGNPTLDALRALALALDVPLSSLVGDGDVAHAGLDVVLASAPPSLLQFSRSPDFQETVDDLAKRQGESVDTMRERLLVGMASSPQRSSGEPTEEDWRRILDAYSLILKKR
jgi:transcriptional regulator with XRE-family HTH domain